MAQNFTCTFKRCLKLLKLVYHKRFCVACRWVHCMCDNIQTDEEAEMCAEDGYRCMLCRPKDVKLPHLLAGALHRSSSTPTRSNSPGKIVYSSVKKSCFVNVVMAVSQYCSNRPRFSKIRFTCTQTGSL